MKMLPRCRSFYGKLIIFSGLAICFLLYVRVLQVQDPDNNTNSDNTNEGNHVKSKYAALQAARGMASPPSPPRPPALPVPDEGDDGESDSINEIVEERKSQNRYELSIRLDIDQQDPTLGAGGHAAHLYGESKELGERDYKRIALNEELSKRLSYNRSLDDSRHPACKLQHFDVATLPTTSVIIIFFDEPYSVLLRTIHSTLNTCAGRLLKEIVLVDDGSQSMELGGKLDYYIKSRLPKDKIKMIRLKNRLGLIRARLAGARVASGDVLIFLDAHCESNIGWCEPLLQRIKESRTSVLVPIIDVIDAKDFQYSTNGYKSFQVGGFDWTGHFDWIDVPDRERRRQRKECKAANMEICPTYSPTMAGGLFAIDRKYFWEIGSYDEQMDGWGGENLEMSFRIWQCGGTIETIPCSRVGHVFRDFHPYKFPNDRDTHGINTARMALVWMDTYINLFFLNRPDLKFNPDIGDVTHRVMLRKKLRCKNFSWYLKNIYPEKFIPTENVKDYGRVKAANSNSCLDDFLQPNEKPFNLGLFPCGKTLSKSQFFSYTNSRVLRNELSCATVQHSYTPPFLVVMVPCSPRDEHNEKWTYIKGQLIHEKTGLCLDSRGLERKQEVEVQPCDSTSETQRWTFERDAL